MLLVDILSILCLYLWDFTQCVEVDLIKKFPIYEQDEYMIRINTEKEKLPLYTILILQCYKNRKITETVVLNPGYMKGLPKKLVGDYFSVLNYVTKPGSVEVILIFKRLANDADLRVIYHETDSESLRTEIISNDGLQKTYNVVSVRISLLLHWKLSLIQRTLDHREGGFVVGSIGTLVCRATEGAPYNAATLSGVDSLDEVPGTSVKATKQSNEAHFVFVPSLKDHRKIVICRAGYDEVKDTIAIFHHPSKVDIIPTIAGFVKNDTTILCKASDGYPIAQSKWVFVRGPPNADLFYSIKGANNVLHIKNSAPVGSKWSFQCTATNTIPNSLNKGTTETINFLIGDKPISVVLIVLLLSALLILICITLIIVVCYRSGKCSNTTKKNSLVPTSGHDQDIFFYPPEKCNTSDKKLLTNSLGNSTTSKNSHISSLTLASKDNNPVDLV